VRRSIAGGPTFDEAALGADTPELRALAQAERELFPPSQRDPYSVWPEELPLPVWASPDKPRVHASGLPPAPPPSVPPSATSDGKSLAWLSTLELSDLPVRWEPRVVRYLEFFKDDPRGRATFTLWHKRSGKYRSTIQRALRKKGIPEDLALLAMIESGFEPSARSPVGALGLWQFMPETGKVYGLFQDRWADQRMSIDAASDAAADHLADLNRRFGSWELAMAAYNMGYGGLVQVIRRYNTNDYWTLSKFEGALPWETTLYVPKILAAAIVSRNLAAFGFQAMSVEPPLEGEELSVPAGVALATVAQACGVTTRDIEVLNPELRASRTPPTVEQWPVKVPAGKRATCTPNLARVRGGAPAKLEAYVVRFGESLNDVAQARKLSVAKIVELNNIGSNEVIRGGTVLLVPPMSVSAEAPVVQSSKKVAERPTVVVTDELFTFPDRRRVFYRIQVGDSIKDVATAFRVTPDELRRWNDIDPSARLVEGMTLQVFAPTSANLSNVVHLNEAEVRVVVPGTEEFFQYWEDKGRRRSILSAKAGETLEGIGKRYGVTAGLMERINRKGRAEPLKEGERVVVWAAGPKGAVQASAPSVRSPNVPVVTAAPELTAESLAEVPSTSSDIRSTSD
jgi:membrane-bound lytic murein transglycosylase D